MSNERVQRIATPAWSKRRWAGKGRAVGGGWSENGGPTSDPLEDGPTGGFYYMDDQLPWYSFVHK
ncbi:hypothetical protein UY286_06785 [Paenibacillus polymyxa]|uniref:hypothetical protein n=1 Tax=Paenibacillus polymyxa TaxID=1406 RepID=UPI002AB424C2|nr:hypothetical protein [Paenibacillus polymyxa]MDY7990313.1 hypothetical protein [Paenibacillus polymyxa]MDY8117147.1 hypothetical protein [Paenibacillus polymyxa]